MAEFEQQDGVTREELVQRVALLEAMIAEGRRYTGRNAWIFVLWGLVDLTAWVWQNYVPRFGGMWAWPICLTTGVVLTLAGKMLQKSDRVYSRSGDCSRVMGVWGMMGLAMGIYERDTDALQLAVFVHCRPADDAWHGACHQRDASTLADAGIGGGCLLGRRGGDLCLQFVEGYACHHAV